MIKQKKGQIVIIIIVLLAVILVGGYLFLNQPGPEEHIHDDTHPHDNIEVIEETDQPTSPQPSNTNQQTKEISVIAKQWEFDPNPIIVNLGDNVILNIESIDVDHGIAIPDFGVSKRLNSGDKEKIEFVADKKGTFTFFCNVGCGSGHSEMKGTLIVE